MLESSRQTTQLCLCNGNHHHKATKVQLLDKCTRAIPFRMQSLEPNRSELSCAKREQYLQHSLNWCNRYSPRTSIPRDPTSVRKQWPKPTLCHAHTSSWHWQCAEHDQLPQKGVLVHLPSRKLVGLNTLIHPLRDCTFEDNDTNYIAYSVLTLVLTAHHPCQRNFCGPRQS